MRVIKNPSAFPVPIINVHPSLLPQWRGASPIQSAILNGDKKTGICLIRMVSELDAGPIFLSHEIQIESHETAGLLSKRLSELSANLIKNNLDDLEKTVSGEEIYETENDFKSYFYGMSLIPFYNQPFYHISP